MNATVHEPREGSAPERMRVSVPGLKNLERDEKEQCLVGLDGIVWKGGAGRYIIA